MTLTIELTPEEEARLAAAARRVLLAPEALIRKWVDALPPLPPSTPKGPATQNTRVDSAAILEEYHALLDKKFTVGLTEAENRHLTLLADEIGSLDMADPITHSADISTQASHDRKIAALDQVIQLLRSAAP
jgi:hypothetical protein